MAIQHEQMKAKNKEYVDEIQKLYKLLEVKKQENKALKDDLKLSAMDKESLS